MLALITLLVGVGWGLSVLVLFQQLAVARCAPRWCDFALLDATTWITPITLATVTALSAAAFVAGQRRGRSQRWVPLSGLAVVGIAFAVASALVGQATSL